MSNDISVFLGYNNGKEIKVTCPNDGKQHMFTVGDITVYMKNGVYDRSGGPALVTPKSSSWYTNGKLNNTNGPAISNEMADYWYVNGKLHRDNDPAIVWKNGDKEWYQNGINYNPSGPSIITKNVEIYNDSNGNHVTTTNT